MIGTPPRRIWRWLAEGLCWACALGRCSQAVKDNTCPCCRRDHGPA